MLTPSLLFQLGVSNSIRGYQVGALAGDRGFCANLEFHRMLTSGLDGFVCHHFGEVRTQGLRHQSARSAGAGLDWQFDPSGCANLTLGRTLKTVLLDQRDWRVTARISWDFR